MSQADPMLELQRIDYVPATASEPILRGVELCAAPGRPVLVSGESGSGKSSLLEVISGLASSSSGRILWRRSVLNQRQRRALCGLVFQFPERYFLGLTVAQELKLGHRHLPTDKINQILKRVGLEKIDTRMAPERLSGGQQRRLSLAVQLLRGARVLLLDEPTAGLDWSVRDEVLSLLADLARDQILIVVTHEPELFQRWTCERHRLEAGRLISLSTLN